MNLWVFAILVSAFQTTVTTLAMFWLLYTLLRNKPFLIFQRYQHLRDAIVCDWKISSVNVSIDVTGKIAFARNTAPQEKTVVFAI